MRMSVKIWCGVVATVMLLGAGACATAGASGGDYVYICTGPKATVYHSTPDCKGLGRCSTEVRKTHRSNVKRRACRICVE